MLPGQLGTGRSVSLTVTENVQLELLPDASVAVHTTLVVPFGKLDPLAGTHRIEPPPQLSVNVAVKLRSEEHTSELQSHSDLVCRLLLEKKKKQKRKITSEQVNNTKNEQ